ncbi:GAP family protein [Nocardioides sp. NPDC127503]|uniref:GAP family protein n=1 Tax=Nocardioides sp. NPDC127503 TaxID=3154516 RepID=UPI003325AF89
MWELVGQLLPEMVGLAVTPAAIVACLLLLGSSYPFRNVVALAVPFLAVYGVLSIIALVAGRAADAASGDPSTTRGWMSVVAGGIFLTVAAMSWLRRPAGRPAARATHRATTAEPGWVSQLRDPSVRLVLVAGLLLAIVNPNVAILASGLGIVVTADVGLGAQVVGIALLLAASMIDFIVPVLVFVAAGERGRGWLRSATRWLLAHNHVIGIVVLVAFGVLFVGRGLGQVIG